MDVDVKKLQDAISYLGEINSHDLQSLTWDGKSSQEVAVNVSLEDYRFMGLNNVFFAEFNGLVESYMKS